jgi:haloacetate dehalogenase
MVEESPHETLSAIQDFHAGHRSPTGPTASA